MQPVSAARTMTASGSAGGRGLERRGEVGGEDRDTGTSCTSTPAASSTSLAVLGALGDRAELAVDDRHPLGLELGRRRARRRRRWRPRCRRSTGTSWRTRPTGCSRGCRRRRGCRCPRACRWRCRTRRCRRAPPARRPRRTAGRRRWSPRARTRCCRPRPRWAGRRRRPARSLMNSTPAWTAWLSSGNEPAGGVLLVDHPEDDRLAGGRGGLVGHEVAEGGPRGRRPAGPGRRRRESRRCRCSCRCRRWCRTLPAPARCTPSRPTAASASAPIHLLEPTESPLVS